MTSRQNVSTVDAAETMRRLLAMVRRVAGRSGYLQILLERPQTLELLALLVARSAWLTDYILAHPIVIDELLQQRLQPHSQHELQQDDGDDLPGRGDINT